MASRKVPKDVTKTELFAKFFIKTTSIVLPFLYLNDSRNSYLIQKEKTAPWSDTRTGLKLSENAANVQRNNLKHPQKAWRIFAQDHFHRLQEKLSALK